LPQRYRIAAVVGPAAIIVAVGAVTIADIRQSADADRWVAHTIEVRAMTAALLAEINAGADTRSDLVALRHLTADNPIQQRHLDTLDALAARTSADTARSVLGAMDAEERRLLTSRQAAAAWWRAATIWAVVIGSAVAALFAIGINALFARSASESAEQAEQLQDQQVELEEQNAALEEQAVELEEQREHALGLAAEANEARLAAEQLVEELQLADAEKIRVEEATRHKSEFLAAMSHELRTPLNAIIGFTQILYDGKVAPTSEEHQEYLGDVLTSARHLLQLINDVLDLSKVEAGKMEFHSEAVDLPALAAEVLAILRTAISGKHIRVETDIDPSLTGVILDAARFKQVLYNYLSNAIKFTPNDGRITVRLQPEGPSFRLEVEDTGPGIAADDLGRLFTRFEQLDAGANRHAGTGLGLALTKRLVEAQGGTVGVRSTLGQGTAFWAVLPRRARSIVPTAGARSIPGANETARTILVVEDDVRDQGILIQTLSGAGYAIETAATGAQALAKARQRPFDAITLDLLLPDMSGLDVLRMIRSEVMNRDVPIIVVTVVADHGAVAGFAVHDFLTKPFDRSALVSSLKRAGVAPGEQSTVLVVDDDPGSRQLMAATLGQLGYATDCVPSGETGLRSAREKPPRAVVLDLMMPEMDGFQFLERFRQLPDCRRVPVIVWTVKNLTVDEFVHLRATTQGVVAKDHESATMLVEELSSFITG
jgi:signal transduction histidine kinase/DNA-binding response OmpR family regulator